MKSLKSQSAMEYLMTYGWAMLIVAVVLGALFGLGFFNSAGLAPKVSPGSCQVYRPDGPGTTTFINTEGTCNNELPQYVAYLGTHSSISTTASITGYNFTVEAWIERLGSSGSDGFGMFLAQSNSYMQSTPEAFSLNNFGDTSASASCGCSAPLDTWTQFVGTVYIGGGSTTVALYVNGVEVGGRGWPITTPIGSGNLNIGPGGYGSNYGFNGRIANVQVYNTSLSANEVTALYQEGIGGDPIDINNLVGWWPLNGNANDYSGNLNNGVPTGVVYTSAWTSGYSAP